MFGPELYRIKVTFARSAALDNDVKTCDILIINNVLIYLLDDLDCVFLIVAK